MAAETLVIRLRENETQEDVGLSPRLAKALRDNFRNDQLRVEHSWMGDGYDLSAGGSIGTISVRDPDGPSLHILIEPKVPIANLFYMLTYDHKLAKFGQEISPLITGEDIFDSVADIFLKQVDDIIRRGIHRGYVDREESAVYLRGRLLMAQQLRRGPVMTRFEQETNEFTADLLENQILSRALVLLSGASFRNPALRPRVRRTLAAFGEVSPVAVTAADCDRVIFTRLTERYRSPINLARLFLQHLSLESHAGETPFVTFLVPMPRLFERFVAQLLAHVITAGSRWELESQWRIWLDEERRLDGRPDLVLKRDGRPRLVLDTKYKIYGAKPTNEDINQMVTYCHTLGVNDAVLLYPGENGGDDLYRMMGGVRLKTRGLALDGSLEAFKARAEVFARTLLQEAIDAGEPIAL